MDSTGYECAFFSNKLGMLFNTHDSKLTVVGLDSNLYGQTAHSTVPSVPIENQSAESNPAPDALYQDAITLNPSLADGTSVAGQANVNLNPISLGESKQEAVEKFLDAFANFDDGSSPCNRDSMLLGSGECDCFFGETNEPVTANVPIPSTASEPVTNMNFPLPDNLNEEVFSRHN